MELNFFDLNNHTVAEAKSIEFRLDTARAAIELMADVYYQGAHYLVLFEENLMPDFFDLKTGVAGEILQQFSTFQMKLVVIGNFEKFESESLQAFIKESNQGTQVAFVDSREAAVDLISKA